ncbi:hypothetical protein GGX14DRAFT_558830 [Mycena pura]|uniref:Zn(2)-C6 fungal-type domain-containing protein n=1 Tax=Mycena pura TaxID=153505 RepID=A0AAD6VS91_9AGAR|nr:hypothetical protein GGX14DRAFT_558830 [Mycena pura]
MSSANKKNDKGKKRATGDGDEGHDGGDEEDDEDEREERRDKEASPGEEPESGRKENPWESTSFVPCSKCHKHSAPCLAQLGKASAGHACARCNAKKVHCSFRDPETGLRPCQNRRKDMASASAGLEADLADSVRTPLQAYLHSSIVDDLLMRVGMMEFKVVQLELGQQAAGLQQIKAEPESEPGLIPVLVQVEDVEMGEPEGEPEPEKTPEVGQSEEESRVEGPVGGEERLVGEGELAIVPEEIEEEEEQCNVPVDAPVEPQVPAPVDVPEPETTAGPAEGLEVKQKPEEGRVPRREPVKIMVDIRREVVKGKEVKVIELMHSDEE